MWRLTLLVVGACGRLGFDAFECPDTYVSSVEGCHRFELDNADELPWLEAEVACERDGAHLAILDDAAELAYITLVMTDVEDAWIGASDRITPDTFITVTGAPFFVQWGGNEPDGTGDCVEAERGAMGDSDCAVKNDYVCEVDGRAADHSTF